MSFFSAPTVRTFDDHWTPEQKPESDLEQMQAMVNTYKIVPGIPSLEKVGAIVYPEVQYAPSWYYPQFSTPQLVVTQPLSAPNVQIIPANWSQAITDANLPKNALAATGVTTSLRAPAINEGM